MTDYKSFYELKGKILKLRDVIVFHTKTKKIRYTVYDRYLNCDGSDNETIFNLLGIKNKIIFCSNIYGYRDGGGGFPESRREDYKKLTEVALELFKLCENYIKEVKVDGEVYI